MIILRLPGKPWKYVDKATKTAASKELVQYAKSLVIPPAYKNVEIYANTNNVPIAGVNQPKILYSGYDDKGRKQSIYSSAWNAKVKSEKFCLLIEFAKKYPKMLSDMKSQLKSSKVTKNKVISTILRIISLCYFRIGNVKYEKLYRSHGISTVHNKHFSVDKTTGTIMIKFIGKKGVLNECTVVDKDTLTSVQELLSNRKNGPVFIYENSTGRHQIKHTDVNNWLKKYHPSFTSKLFRTLDTNLLIISRLNSSKLAQDKKSTETQRKKVVISALKVVSEKVHNTPAICKKDYSDSKILTMFVTKPKEYIKHFVAPKTTVRTAFVAYLKSQCSTCSKSAKK
jgi:DNA topoisomerase-1